MAMSMLFFFQMHHLVAFLCVKRCDFCKKALPFFEICKNGHLNRSLGLGGSNPFPFEKCGEQVDKNPTSEKKQMCPWFLLVSIWCRIDASQKLCQDIARAVRPPRTCVNF